MDPVPILPQELHDHILDYLFDDKPALRQCALASRTWSSRAQHHLFRSIYIDWSNCYALSRLFTVNPPLAAHVATLEIEGAFGIFSMDRLHGATLDAWLRAIPNMPWFPHALTSLAKLELALITIDAELVRRVFGRLTSIRHLTLWACALTSFDVFVELYASFPALKRLSIAFTQEWETSPRPLAGVPTGAQMPQLEVVDLTSCCDNFKVLRWLVAHDLHRSIHTFSCSRVLWSSLASFATVLFALAPTLRTLRVGFGDHTANATESDTDLPSEATAAAAGLTRTQMSLAPLPALTALTLDINTGRLAAVPYTLFLLLHLPMPALSMLTFAIKCGEYDTSALVPWPRIAEAAARVVQRAPLRAVVVSAKERGADGVVASGAFAVGRSVPSVDFGEMERLVRDAFEVQGLEKLVRFMRKG